MAVAPFPEVLAGPAASTGPAPTPPTGRKRGRPAGKRKAAAGASPSPKPAAAERSPKRPPKGVTRAEADQVKGALALALIGMDAAAAAVLPALWTAEDRLAEHETAKLVSAVYGELAAYPSLIHALANVAGQGTHVRLLLALASVAVPRLARRGLVPAHVVMAVALMDMNMPPPAEPADEPAPAPTVGLESGPAFDLSWSNGDGKEHASGAPVERAPVRDGAPVQAGQSDL